MMRATPYCSVSPMRDQRIHAAEHDAGERMSQRWSFAFMPVQPPPDFCLMSDGAGFHAGFGDDRRARARH